MVGEVNVNVKHSEINSRVFLVPSQFKKFLRKNLSRQKYNSFLRSETYFCGSKRSNHISKTVLSVAYLFLKRGCDDHFIEIDDQLKR